MQKTVSYKRENIPGSSITEDSPKLQDVLKKSTNFSSDNSRNTEQDVFKAEAMKIIKKCDNSENKKQNDTENNNGYNRTYSDYNNYSNQNNTRDFRDNGYNTNYGGYRMNNNNNRNNNKNSYSSYEYGSNGNSNSQIPSKNCTKDSIIIFDCNHKSPSYNNDNDDQNESRDQGTYYNSYRGEENNGYLGGSDYDRNYFSSRIRRSEKRNNENQCISQCVFGYMELMDENQTPSETLVIKWLQDHIPNNDLKRIKALREVRRCFAKLSTSDVEDGCEFSKQLSNCMNLDLE